MMSVSRIKMLFFLFLLFSVPTLHCIKDIKSSCNPLRIGQKLRDISIEPYVTFATILPHNAFQGEEHSVTLKLSTKKETFAEKCWFSFDPYTLLLTFLADNDVIRAQPTEGFLFELEAQSRCSGEKMTQSFRVKLYRPSYVTCMYLQIVVAPSTPLDNNACAMDVIRDVLVRAQDYMSHESAGQALSCLLQEYTIQKDGLVRFIMGYLVEHPSQCQHLCTDNFFGPYVRRVVDGSGNINKRFNQLLSPAYTTFSAFSEDQCSVHTTPDTIASSTPAFSSPTITSLTPKKCEPPLVLSKMNDVAVGTNNRPFAFVIPENLFEKKHSLTLSLHLRSNTPSLCWFRFSPPSVNLFPTNQVVRSQPSNGYRFELLATNACGLSATVPFALTMKREPFESCLVFEVEVEHPENLCDESTLSEFFQRLQDASEGTINILDISTRSERKSSINFTVLHPSFDCSSCNLNALNNLTQQFSLKSLVSIFSRSNVVTSVTSSRTIVTSECKKVCEKEERVEIIINPRAGRINKIELPKDVKGVSLPQPHNTNICLVRSVVTNTPTHILYLPPFPPSTESHPSSLQKHQIELVEEGKACPIVMKGRTSQEKTIACHRITLRIRPVQTVSCALQAVESVVKLITNFFRVHTSKIFVHNFQENSTAGDLFVSFSFSTDIIGCTHCAKVILKTFISRLVDSEGKATKEFGEVLLNKFTFLGITSRVTSQGKISSHQIVIDDDHVPIWVYMVPAFILLFILLLLLLSCCFCCGAISGSKRRFSKFVSSCCFCCYGTQHQNKRRRGSSMRRSTIHRVASSSSKDVECNMSLTDVHRVPSCDETIATTQGTKSVSYATVHKNHGLSSPSASTSVELSPSSTVSSDIMSNHVSTLNTQGNTSSVIATTTLPMPTKAVVGKSALRSSHRRSYSDGFILDDDYLDLPSPPLARKTNDISRKTSHRASTRYRSNNAHNTSNNLVAKETHKISIPIRITARVKNISRSLENGLDRSTNYITFEENGEEGGVTPDLSKYRSKETVYERKSPLDTNCDGETRYRRKSLEKFTTTKRYPWESRIKTFRRTSTKKWFDAPRYSRNWRSYSESEF